MAPDGPGAVHSGRRIVFMQTARHGHCIRLGIYGAALGWEDTARLKSQGEFSNSCSCWLLSSDSLSFVINRLPRYELLGCDVPPELWRALPPRGGVQGDVLQPPSAATTGEERSNNL